MSLSAKELNAQILMLPEHEQQKVFYFVLDQQKNQVRHGTIDEPMDLAGASLVLVS